MQSPMIHHPQPLRVRLSRVRVASKGCVMLVIRYSDERPHTIDLTNEKPQ